ncbi:unnamed protein product [Colias eurytheme]|nr:unnamed protein product [Colias eurytheme]
MITRSKSKRTTQRIESEDVGYKHVTSPSSSSSKSQLSLYSSSSSSCFRSPTISLSSSSSSNLGLTDVAQEAESVQVPVPNVSAAEVRKRWSKEMNEFILRTYLLLTNMESDTNAYLPPLHTKFLEKYPYMEVSRQRIGDQRRAIIQKNLLPKTTIDRIYKEVRIELQTNNNYHSAQLLSNTGTQIGQRMKWTKEYNESILKIYLRITQLESNKTAYRKLLHEEFIATHPELGHLSEQRIADQRRAIINNKYITDNRLAEIKQEISNELKIQNRENNYSQSLGTQPQQQLEAANINNTYTSHEEENIHTEEQALSGDNTLQELTAPIYNTTETTVDLNQKIESTFHEAEQLFANTDPTSRPFIRRQKLTKKFSTIVQYINTTILPTKLHPDIEFNTLHNILYCAAWTAAKCNGTKIEQQLQEIHHTQTKKIPSWQKRLEKQIADLRASIGRVTQFINGNRSRRIISTVETIKLKYATHAQHENSNSDPQHFLDTLKQKLSAKSARLKRYLKCTERKKQNAIFISNEKGFYRTLNSSENNTINRNNNIPSKEALREFWANIWENPEQHSDNTEWIKELQQETSGICDMEFEFIPADIFIDVIQRTHNWKAPGTDHIHNYWYKKFTCLYPYIHNHINAFIQSPHTLPTFITHGITYMLPKDPDDTCNPAKYRPITCLQTFYKILTACISRVINQHLTKYNILAEQQKGCRKDSQGCKEQLTIDAIAMKTATNQKKDIYSMFIDYQKAFDSVPHSWKHHPKSCVQRLTLPRSEGGRGLIDIQNLHNQQIRTLRSYFHTKSEHSLLHKHATQLDKKLTPLNLHDTNPQQNEHSVSIQQKLLEWSSKALHGRHRSHLCQAHVDREKSNEWIRRGDLFPETEGFMLAIQDEPKAYEFGYSVKDAKSGNDYDRREMSDGNVVRGEYRVVLPDGRTQIVSYHADWQTGYHADVRYEGEAQYPETNTNVLGSGSGYNYNAPEFGGSLTGFHGNGQQLPKPSYGPPAFH